MGKDLTGVRSPQRKLMPDTAGSEKRKQTSLWGIAGTASRNKRHRFRNLYGCLTPELLLQGWQRLNKQAASGVDSVTAEDYVADLQVNLERLAKRLRQKKYKAKLVRRKWIPKGNGKERPLGIPALEDKIVQTAVAMIMNAIYEQDFLDCSYGYRPKRSAKDAVSDVTFQLQYGVYGYVVEADIKGFFDNLDHEWLLKMLAHRIDDKAFLNLIRKWLKAGILETDGRVVHPDTGTPQGGIVSPILANVYLHYVLDLWFTRIVAKHCEGRVNICRYADDWVCMFQYRRDAHKVFRVLPKRLEKFNLEVEPTKTRIVRFSRFYPSRRRSISFLGFDLFWFNDRSGTARAMRKTMRKRQLAALKRSREWIKSNRHLPKRLFFKVLNAKLIGHYNYYYVRGNSRSVWSYYWQVIKFTFKWLNRRSQRKSYTWRKFILLLEYVNIARPRVTECKRQHRVVC